MNGFCNCMQYALASSMLIKERMPSYKAIYTYIGWMADGLVEWFFYILYLFNIFTIHKPYNIQPICSQLKIQTYFVWLCICSLRERHCCDLFLSYSWWISYSWLLIYRLIEINLKWTPNCKFIMQPTKWMMRWWTTCSILCGMHHWTLKRCETMNVKNWSHWIHWIIHTYINIFWWLSWFGLDFFCLVYYL